VAYEVVQQHILCSDRKIFAKRPTQAQSAV
jgi:hypothetical protein